MSKSMKDRSEFVGATEGRCGFTSNRVRLEDPSVAFCIFKSFFPSFSNDIDYLWHRAEEAERTRVFMCVYESYDGVRELQEQTSTHYKERDVIIDPPTSHVTPDTMVTGCVLHAEVLSPLVSLISSSLFFM